jgi:hypothetical protein
MENTFTKDITYISNQFDNEKQEIILKPVTKTFTFYELSRTEKKQSKLFFLMFPLYRNTVDMNGNERTIADPEVLENLTRIAIDVLMICPTVLEEQDKKEVLNDSMALVYFGQWFLSNKFTPFFLNSLTDYVK